MEKHFTSWEEAFTDCDFGDIRRNRRVITIANEIENKMSKGVSSTLTNRGDLKAACRFFKGEAVTPDSLTNKFIDYNFEKLNCKHVLIVQDTTEFNFGWRKTKIAGLGSTTKDSVQGFFLHPGIIVNPENESVLGLASINMWSRLEENRRGGKDDETYKRLPVEEKESYKWFITPERVKERISEQIKFTIVGDRESDIFELFHRKKLGEYGNNCELLVRACKDRKIVSEDSAHLFEKVEKWPVSGEYEIQISATKNRSERATKLSIRFNSITIDTPKINKRTVYKPVNQINVVDAVEENPPDGEEPLHWTLLTTWKVTTLEQAIETLKWYKQRWFIEELFRILKSGYKVESVKFDNAHSIMNWCALRLMMAVRILYLVKQRDTVDKNSAMMFFSRVEIAVLEKLEKKLIPKKAQINIPPKRSMAWAVLIIAIFGGYKAAPSAKPPGQGVLWRGLDRLEGASLVCDFF